MPGGAIVGALRYLVEVDGAEAAGAKIDRFLADNEAKMKAAGGDVTIRVLAEISEADRKIAELEKRKAELQAKQATVKVGAETGEVKTELMAVQKELDRMSHERTELQIKLKGAAEVVAELEAVKRLQNDVNKSQAVNTKGQLQQSVAVAKLRENYNRLASEVKRFEAIKPAARRTEGENLTLARMRNEMALMEHEGARMGAGLEKITQDVEGNRSAWRRWSDTISKAHINFGPFSTTMKGLGAAIVGLGPILMGLVGSASALIGAVGVGLVGAFGVAAGAAAGLGLSALGAGIALHQPIHQLGVAHHAATMYADAVQKYGKNSTQAKDKQSQMNNALKGLPPEAQKAVVSLGQMRNQFMQLGGNKIRGDFFSSFAQGIQSAKALLPAFARGSATAFHAASQGFNDWMKGLRSPEAQGILSNLMGNFSKDIGPVMAGLGGIGTAFGRFISIASNAGPGISQTFQRWGQSLASATGSGTGFAQTVNDMVSKAKTLGSFLTATGRVVWTFFSSGASAGQGMLKTMTAAENRWTSWMKSVQGQQSLHQFFADSVKNTTALWHALAPLARTFTALGNAFMPLTTGLLQGASYIGKFIHFLTQIPGLLPLIHGLGVGLAGVFAVTKIAQWTGMIQKAAVFLGLMAAPVSADTAATVANTAALEANTAARAGQDAAVLTSDAALAANTAETEANAVAQGGLAGRLGAGRLAFLGMGAGAGLAVGAAALLAGGLIYLAITTDRSHTRMDRFNGTLARFQQNAAGVVSATQREAQAAAAHAKATKGANDALAQANKLSKEGKTNTDAYTKAGNKLVDQQNHQHTTAVQQAQAEKQHNAELQAAGRDVQNLQRQYDSLNKQIEAGGRQHSHGIGGRAGVSQQDLQNLQQMSRSLNLAKINLDRLHTNRPLLPANALDSINKIRSIAGQKIALHLATTGTPAALADVARLTARANALGAHKQVVKILGNASNATQAAVQITNLLRNIRDKHININANNSQATSAVQQLQQEVDALHGKTITNYVNNVIRHGASSGRFMGGIEAFAGGGMMERAYEAADKRGWQWSQKGAKIKQPTYITGEEPGRTEYIITDNPAYRKSNLAYLMEAARALGANVVPGFGKGGKKKPKKGGSGPQTYGNTLDDNTGPGTPYDLAEKNVTFLAALVDLENRRLGQGTSTAGNVVARIENEIAGYRNLASLISGLAGSHSAQKVKVPDKPAKPKNPNKQQKAQYQKDVANWQTSVNNAQAHNQSVTGGISNLADELNTINNITIPGLQLDEIDVNNQAASALTAQNASFNAVSMSIFRDFSSNISTIIGSTFGGALAGISPSSINANPVGTTVAGSSGIGVGSSQNTPAMATNGVNITNNFAGPPADPFTWTQQQAFEVQAA